MNADAVPAAGNIDHAAPALSRAPRDAQSRVTAHRCVIKSGSTASASKFVAAQRHLAAIDLQPSEDLTDREDAFRESASRAAEDLDAGITLQDLVNAHPTTAGFPFNDRGRTHNENRKLTDLPHIVGAHMIKPS